MRIPLNLPSTKNNLPKPAQIKQSRENTRNNNLTRFGLDAYVLGAMKERAYYFERRLQCVQPAPACRSTGRSTQKTRKLGVCQSEPCGRPAGRPRPFLCMLCTSVDRAGRPTTLTSAAADFSATVTLPFLAVFDDTWQDTWHGITFLNVVSPPTTGKINLLTPLSGFMSR